MTPKRNKFLETWKQEKPLKEWKKAVKEKSMLGAKSVKNT